jgi:hypothetical protein
MGNAPARSAWGLDGQHPKEMQAYDGAPIQQAHMGPYTPVPAHHRQAQSSISTAVPARAPMAAQRPYIESLTTSSDTPPPAVLPRAAVAPRPRTVSSVTATESDRRADSDDDKARSKGKARGPPTTVTSVLGSNSPPTPAPYNADFPNPHSQPQAGPSRPQKQPRFKPASFWLKPVQGNAGDAKVKPEGAPQWR